MSDWYPDDRVMREDLQTFDWTPYVDPETRDNLVTDDQEPAYSAWDKFMEWMRDQGI